MQELAGYLDDERGATAAEYAMILAFVALALFVAVNNFSLGIGGRLTNFSTMLAGS